MKGPVEPVHRSVPETIQEVIELTGFLCFLFRSTPSLMGFMGLFFPKRPMRPMTPMRPKRPKRPMRPMRPKRPKSTQRHKTRQDTKK